MRLRSPRLFHATRRLAETYTQDVTTEELHRLTRDTRDAFRYFSSGIDRRALQTLPWRRRVTAHARELLLAFSLKLSPARRLLYGAAGVTALVGIFQLWRGFGLVRIPLGGGVMGVSLPLPVWVDGTLWLLAGFLALNLLIVLELADRLSLKNDLEIAKEIQQALLPQGTYADERVEVYGVTRPANTVGGDFYDIRPLADGRLVVALGDVSGKGSPAALVMALLLAFLHTLLDEGLEPATLVERLNIQVARHTPGDRFVTMFFGAYDPRSGAIEYVNAGQNPPLLRRQTGELERLTAGGVALGMFGQSQYCSGSARLAQGDLLVLYSDGITEAEDPTGRPLDESGLQRAIEAHASGTPQEIAGGILGRVSAHAQDTKFADDLTVLTLRRLSPDAAGLAATRPSTVRTPTAPTLDESSGGTRPVSTGPASAPGRRS